MADNDHKPRGKSNDGGEMCAGSLFKMWLRTYNLFLVSVMHFPLKLLVASVQGRLCSSNLANLMLAVYVTLFWPAKTN